MSISLSYFKLPELGPTRASYNVMVSGKSSIISACNLLALTKSFLESTPKPKRCERPRIHVLRIFYVRSIFVLEFTLALLIKNKFAYMKYPVKIIYKEKYTHGIRNQSFVSSLTPNMMTAWRIAGILYQLRTIPYNLLLQTFGMMDAGEYLILLRRSQAINQFKLGESCTLLPIWS